MQNSNPLYQEVFAQRREEEMRHLAASSQANFDSLEPHPKWLAHQLVHLADWMIHTGEHLQQRYDQDAFRTKHSHAVAH